MARAAADDMASSALVALMERSFRRQRLDIARLDIRKDGAHASLRDKAAAAETVLRLHGPGPLLLVGASIGEMARDPLAAALLSAPSGRAVFDRWRRLERYVHTRHPIVMHDMTDNSATLDHRGDPGDPPSPAINFVLAGLFVHLLRAVGCQDVALAMGPMKQMVRVEGETGQISCRDNGLWSYRWTPAAERRKSPKPDAAGRAEIGGKISRDLSRLIQDDLLQTWSLAEAATALAVSTRTLQRRLGEEGLTLTAVRRRAQIELASRHLLSGEAVSLSSIGYACGFSDLPHFTRMFSKHVGMAPSAFRSLSIAQDVAGHQP